MTRSYRERAEHAWTEDSVRLVVTPSLFARTALFYVQEIGHFRTLASYFTERERLDSFLVLYTVSGRGRLVYGDKAYTLQPQQVFFIDCMEYQYYAAEGDEPWELLWVHLNGASTRAYYEKYEENGEPVRHLPHDSPLPVIVRQLIELNRQKSFRSELAASASIAGLLTELLLAGSPFDSDQAEMPSSLTGALRLIEQHYREKLTLALLAKTFAVDKYHFAKQFKRYTGYSPGEYIINARITKAKELLKYSDLSVAEVAGQVGIENISHFINLFKDRAGQTPLAFRKRWQNPRQPE
ncbi:MAG TPA: AraC family transcriptional regulator [Paenibacillus sp.]|uniref:AraC family transcriptional regulator n=1 Tax=Paenibacillus sp. TaxID=58172 RepID=UPI002C62D6E7|nr:AraC family transcriptional regulator [Paenibacillus sp.]HUC92878.1 AraC family transcriptional regulator [Paenibacillus sp.]